MMRRIIRTSRRPTAAAAVLRPLLTQLRRDERGNLALVVAAVFPLLIGAAGLAVDGTEWVLQKRQIQAAADHAAVAGVYGLISSQDLDSVVNQSVIHDGTVPDDASIQAVRGPAGRETDPFAVSVRIAAPAQMTFSSMFMKHPPVISGEATASVVQNGRYCAFALGDMDDEPGVVLRANTDAKVDCGVTTNATSSRALEADGSSTLQAFALRAYGSFSAARAAVQHSGIREHSLMQDDPLADTDPPLVPNTGCPNVTINPGEKEIPLDPGCYANMMLNGNVRLQDGEYILNRGNFVVGPQGHVLCDACTIFLTSEDAGTAPGSIGKVKISSDATVKMSATREGPNAGILFYQDRHGTSDLPGDENRIGGSSFSTLKGLLYFPSQTLYLDGNMSPDIQCTRFIARRLVFAGRVYIGKDCDGERMTFAVTEVRLIG
jgi:Putative Flp pilus-assembly TadE/G-like